MALIDILFIGTIIAGASVVAFSRYALKKYGTEVGYQVLKVKHISIILLAIGFSLHTAGDFFGSMLDSETVELVIESTAHIILFAAFIVMVKASEKIISTSKEYWFK